MGAAAAYLAGTRRNEVGVELNLFLQGIVIGLTLAAPVGPIALICIRRTIAEGKFHGIASGIGVATADCFYAAVAVLGLTAVSGFIISSQYPFRILASVLLIGAGTKIFFSVPPEICVKKEQGTYLKDFLSMVAIALANPLTIIFFVGILPGFGIVFPGTSPVSSLAFVLGIFSGSVMWWAFLCGLLGSIRSCLSSGTLRYVNRASGLMIACLGAALFLYAVMLR